jgi:hypothetical protein
MKITDVSDLVPATKIEFGLGRSVAFRLRANGKIVSAREYEKLVLIARTKRLNAACLLKARATEGN